jgi:transcription factor C subunit 6
MSNIPARRSGRTRVTPKKYTVDAFDNLEGLLSDSSISNNGLWLESDSDEEFDQRALAKAEGVDQVEELDDEPSDLTNSDEPGDDEPEVDDDESVIEVGSSRVVRYTRTRKPQPISKNSKDGIHTTGIGAFNNRLSKEDRVIARFGTGEEDIIAYVKFRDLWQNGYCMPTRKEIARSTFYPAEKRYREATEGFRWYYDLGGRELFNKQQEVEPTLEANIKGLFPDPKAKSSFIMGPIDDPNLFQLAPFESITLQEAFGKSNPTQSSGARSGWILNIHSTIQCLQWVPNRNGMSQYLAISTKERWSPDQLKARNKANDCHLSLFDPRPPKRSCIQLWEFAELDDMLDATQLPQLRAVLSFDWNEVRQLKWCPAPMRDSETEDPNEVRLGLLAGVWMDGCIRVLDIVLPNQNSTAYLHISKACFKAKPPDTICTTLTWLSTQAIAAGCANGHLAVWDLPSALHLGSQNLSSPKAVPDPRPWFYKQMHDTCISNLTSGYPSRPFAIFTNSLDGYTQLTDLRDPRSDTVYPKRARLNQAAMAWHDATQQLLSSDENGDLISHFLRLFHTRESMMRWNSLITDIATSELHPIILAACADGTVGAVNASKRIKNARMTPVPAGKQAWFKHEWRGPVRKDWDIAKPEAAGGEAVDAVILNNPLGRFIDGYRVERLVSPNTTKPNFSQAIPYSTIHEARTAITKVSWNPNLSFGTWAVAATGSGLVRIEDLAIE